MYTRSVTVTGRQACILVGGKENMAGGFRYFAGGMMLVILVFAGISLWPLLNQRFAPAAQPLPTIAPPQPAPPPVPTSPPQTPVTQTFPEYKFTDDLEAKPVHPGWLYCQESTILRIKPGGIGFPPISLNNAPLTLAKGTRVWPRETDGDWVMIKSPGGRLGWVRAIELDKRRPHVPKRD